MVTIFLAMNLSACATRPGPEQLTPVTALVADVERVKLFAVTNRASAGPVGPAFGSGRGEPSFEEFTIGVAPSPSTYGSVSQTRVRNRDLAKDFVTLERRQLDEAVFSRRLTEHGANNDTILLFVHGYNYSYQEAVFRLAELSNKVSVQATPILFSWPSQASIRGYVADRDGAIYARDDLVQLLTRLGRQQPGKQIVVVGHSMGAWLVMESLRQLRLQGHHGVLERLQVGLAAPDIDIDVFRAQMAVVGQLTTPLSVLVARDDRALALSQRVAEGRPRLGAVDVNSPEIHDLARQTGARIVDITNIPAGDSFNHDRFAVLAELNSLHAARLADRINLTGAYILDASGSIFSMPFTR